jgi:hypothetical protein
MAGAGPAAYADPDDIERLANEILADVMDDVQVCGSVSARG